MPHPVGSKNKTMASANDVAFDFASLKVSALAKASRISGEVDRITIGPDCNNTNQSENIENEQNSCNVKTSPRGHSTGGASPTANGVTFSVKKILLESELQRKEEVRKEIERHWQQMKANGRQIQESMALSRTSMARERERRSAEKLAKILAEEEQMAEQEELRRKEEQQLRAQCAQEQRERLEREMEEYRLRMREREELTRKAVALRSQFAAVYCEIGAVSKACKDKASVANLLYSHSGRLMELCQQVELVDKRLKAGELSPAELIVLGNMVAQVTEILNVVRADIEKIDAALEARILKEQQEAEAARQIAAEQQVQPITEIVQEHQDKPEVEVRAAGVETPASPRSPEIVAYTSDAKPEEGLRTNDAHGHLLDYVDKESLQIYVRSKQFLDNYTNSYSDFTDDPATKKFRFECQKAINIPVNAISGTSGDHLKDKYQRLHNLLAGAGMPNVSQYPQGAAFCKNILAKKIVNQGETLVSSKPKMAFPIAAVIVAIWNEHADFGELLLAHFHEACPFIVPLFLPKTEGQSNEDYYKSLGFKYGDDGTVEKHDKYLKRMSGLIRLYASITITSQRRGVAKPHPHGVQHAWRWLAAVLNTEPRVDTTDLCATLILDMLEVAGSTLWLTYPKQFHKLLLLLSTEYFPRMQAAGSIGGGPLARLEEFLRKTLTRSAISPPDGQLPANFW